MGNVLETLRSNSFRKNSSVILGVSLTKLRDYHACFKSICDHFSVDLNEFEHVFGAGEADFVIWDSDNNGLVDSLELFAGVALFSDTKVEDRARFLFDMFDFNETDKFALLDVEFMFYSCVSSAYKIFSIQGEVDVDEVADFVQGCFGKYHDAISISNLIHTVKERDEIRAFLDIARINKKHSTLQSLG